MIKIYTENDLLLYLYKDLSENETAFIKAELSENSDLYESYLQLKSGIEALDAFSEEPSPTSVNLILEYATKLKNSEMEIV